MFAIFCDGECVGTCGVNNVDAQAGADEVGYWVGRDHWGRGIATAAAELLIECAGKVLGLGHLHALTLEQNPASSRVLEKLGFERAGCFRDEQGMRHAVGDIIIRYERTRSAKPTRG